MSVNAFYPACRAILQVVLDGFGDDSKDSEPTVVPVLPKSARVHINSYREADTFELTFDANDLPVDPQQIKAGAVEIYLFAMPGIVADQQVIDRQFATSDQGTADQARTSVEALRQEYDVAGAVDKFAFDNPPRILGQFDGNDVEKSEDGKWVTISGQDYTAMLCKKQWPPTAARTPRRIPVGKPLDVTISDLLFDADPDGPLKLVLDPTNLEMPVVGKGETASRHGITVQESTSYWDVMYGLAIRYGFILYVRGLDVVLGAPKNIDLDTHEPKRLAWGKNLASVRLTRHLGKVKTPRIIVQGYNKLTRQNVFAQFPDTGLGAKQVVLKGQPTKTERSTERVKATPVISHSGKPKTPTVKQEDEYQIIPAGNISDVNVLKRMAETRYRLLGSSERTLVAVTKDMRDLNDSSLMSLESGDAVTVEWLDFNREDFVNEYTTEAMRYQHLVARGYNPQVANLVAANYTVLLSQLRPMRLHEVSYDFDVESGLSIEMELQDFVVIDGQRDADAKTSLKVKRLDSVRDSSGKRIGNPLIDGGSP